MAENTKIEWAHHTHNHWYGCMKVSLGCDHCYAEGWARRSGLVQWGHGSARRLSSEANRRKPLAWNAEAARLGVRYRVFCSSLADVFDNEVPVEWRVDLFELIRQTPSLDWLLLTKRIGNFQNLVAEAIHHIEAAPDWTECGPPPKMEPLRNFLADWDALKRPPINVWIGATICNQEEADRDIPKLLAVPATKRFMSIEPMLGPIDLKQACAKDRWIDRDGVHCCSLPRHLNWVIVGGETGPGARPMHPEWVRSLRDQCHAAGVPFFFKQWGKWEVSSIDNGHHDGNMERNSSYWISLDGTMHKPSSKEQNDPIAIVRVGKKAAGRLLDGVLHDEYPVSYNTANGR